MSERPGVSAGRAAGFDAAVSAVRALAVGMGAGDMLAASGPAAIGLSGAQGSGKTTLAEAVRLRLEADGLRTAVLALDDFYLPRSARQALARAVHPLCAVRGVPGTHDAGLIARTLDALMEGAPGSDVAVPRFSKLDDDRMDEAHWRRVGARPDVVLFEGWCVGAQPVPAAVLADPVNALEAEEDADGVWRGWWNACLARDYVPLWARLARLAVIVLPDMASVVRARLRQEHDLARARGGPAVPGREGMDREGMDREGMDRVGMDRGGVERFVAHYERLTRHMWAEMPARADLVLARDDSFRFEVLKPRPVRS